MFNLTFDTSRLGNLCASFDVRRLRVFGSVARGEARVESDIDILVDFSTKKGLLDLISLERSLADIFHRQVDLLTESAISPHLRDRILAEAVSIYEAR